MLREMYMALKAHLETNIPALQYIDWHLNQFIQDGGDHILVAPGLYIRFNPTSWTTKPDKLQMATLEVEFHHISETAYGDERDMLDTSYINHLGTEEMIHKMLMNKRFLLSDVPGFGNLKDTTLDKVLMESMVRVQSQHHSEISNIIQTSQTYQCTVFDYSATPAWKKVMAQLDCEMTLEVGRSKTYITQKEKEWWTAGGQAWQQT